MIHFISKFKIGWRTIKTVTGVFIILVSYHYIEREPAVLAALACVFAMQTDVPTSVQFGGYRILGNALGAVIGGLIFQLEETVSIHHDLLHIVLITLGLLIIIVICNAIGINKSIVNSSATYFVVLLTISSHEIVFYTINRVLDAIIGVTVAIVVNYLLPGPFPQELQNSHDTPSHNKKIL